MRIGRFRQLLVAERPRIDHDDRRIRAIGVVAVKVGRTIEAVLAGAAINVVFSMALYSLNACNPLR